MWKAAVGEPLLSAEEGRQGRVKGVCVCGGAVGPEAAWWGVQVSKRVSAFVSTAMESYGPEKQETKGLAMFLLALFPAWNSEMGFRPQNGLLCPCGFKIRKKNTFLGTSTGSFT